MADSIDDRSLLPEASSVGRKAEIKNMPLTARMSDQTTDLIATRLQDQQIENPATPN
jgi:hypothetical protein